MDHHSVAPEPQEGAHAEAAPAPAVALSVTLGALLAACGGGDATVPDALNDGRSAPFRPDLLPHDRASDLQPHHLAALAGDPAGRRGRAARSPTADEFFEWAEQTFPQFFPGPAQTLPGANGLLVRFYPSTQIYLSVSNDVRLAISGMGPVTNNQAVSLGRVADFADAILAPTPAAVPLTDEDAARFLQHAQFSSTLAQIAAVRANGYAGWLDAQLALPLGQTGWDWLIEKGYSAVNEWKHYNNGEPTRYMTWQQLMARPDQVRRRWALALSEIFVVSLRGLGDMVFWPSFMMAAYWDILCKHAFGNYRDLLQDLTLNPAMGAFLNTKGNEKEDPATGRLPDENYAREVMQLFSIGLHELNLDGSPKLNAQGKPIETYTASDVSNLARVFTGYDHDFSVGRVTEGPPHFAWKLAYARNAMVFDPAKHSSLEKKFLGITIPAGTPGPAALSMALDTLFNHPNVGPFLGRQFIQRLVTSNPSAGYVARVASVFNRNSAGVRGDLKAVLRAVLLDPEARGAASLASATFGKLRTPSVRVAQWGQSFGVRSIFNTWKPVIKAWRQGVDVNHYPLDAPSVFNFFRPGYVPPRTAMARVGATAPEFQIVNEGTVASWSNFIALYFQEGVFVRGPDVPQNVSTAADGLDVVPDYTFEKQLVGDLNALVRHLNVVLCAGQLSAASVQTIVAALTALHPRPTESDERRQGHVARALMFVMSAPEYIVQR
jgi:uncharacterized protein (DUF1800 family)